MFAPTAAQTAHLQVIDACAALGYDFDSCDPDTAYQAVELWIAAHRDLDAEVQRKMWAMVTESDWRDDADRR